MVRLGLSARLAAIVATFLLAAWVGLIAIWYRTNGLDRAAARPSPQRLARIVEVVSEASPTARPRLLEALSSATLAASIETSEIPHAGPIRLVADAPAAAAPYRAALGERLLEVGRPEPAEAAIVPARLFAASIGPVRFRLGLADGAVLRLETRSPFVVTLAGLPAGLGAGLLGTLLALVAFVVLHREIRPLTRLAAAVDRLDPSGEPVRLPRLSVGAPETAALAGAIDRLQTRLQALIGARFAFVGGVQHDVRTFATRLRLRVEGIADEDERERAIADISDMIDLLDTALLTARAGVGALNEEMLDLAALVFEDVRDLAAAGWAVRLGGATSGREATIIADRVAMKRILANLVDNAVKYGGEAVVDLAVVGEEAVVAVSDRGPGMAPEEVDHLFEPFVRAEPSRARSTGGAGLGLAVVRNLVEAQAGRLTVGRAATGGARVELRFPLFTA